MDTAMNASKKIRTPPTIGSTNGISGTMASTGSTTGPGVWDEGADMGNLSMENRVSADSTDKAAIVQRPPGLLLD
jgi:hypothetical protein